MVKKINIKPDFSIFDLLKKYNLNNNKIAIEYNGAILPKTKFKKN